MPVDGDLIVDGVRDNRRDEELHSSTVEETTEGRTGDSTQKPVENPAAPSTWEMPAEGAEGVLLDLPLYDKGNKVVGRTWILRMYKQKEGSPFPSFVDYVISHPSLRIRITDPSALFVEVGGERRVVCKSNLEY